jgi:hypothetical protein
LSHPGRIHWLSLCHEWTLLCSVCTDWRSIILHFPDDLSPCVTYDQLLAWWMPLVEQACIDPLELVCPTPVLMWSLLFKPEFSNEDHWFSFVLSLCDLCHSVCWRLPIFPLFIGSQIVIVFSTYFILCSNVNNNQITSIQSGAFNDLPRLTELWVWNPFLVVTYKTWICLVNDHFYIQRF